ncbi:MAG: hypothetical protein U0X73_14915 [Thermoanaerobaculia bacterium]
MPAPFALLLYFAVAAAAVALARWALGTLTWRSGALLAALPLTITGRALLTGRVLAPIDLPWSFPPLAGNEAVFALAHRSPGILSDVFTQMIPWRAAVRFAFARGEWPLWNPFIQCGDPLAGSAQAAPYFPSNLLSLLLPLPEAFAFVDACLLLSAALGAFLLLRELGVREPGAMVGAAAWTFSSFVLFWTPWPQGQSAALLPLVLLATRRLVAKPALESTLLLAAALALLLLTGHPESWLHVVSVGVVYGGFELATRRRELARVAGATLAAGALAAAIAALFWLPFVAALPETTEHYLRTGVFLASSKNRPLADALDLLRNAVVPFAHGTPGKHEIGGPDGASLPSTAYVGSVLFLPIGLALARRARGTRFWSALALFGLALGVSLPPFGDWLARLPLFDIALNERLVMTAVLALAVLAGLGFERWSEPAPDPRSRPWRNTGMLVVAGLLALLGLFWRGLVASDPPSGFLATSSAWLLLPPLAAALLLDRVARPWRRALLLVGLLVAQRLGEQGHLFQTFPREAFYPRVAPLDRVPRLAILPASEEPYRVTGFGVAMVPNSSALWGLEDVRGDQAFTFKRLVETRRLLGAHDAIGQLLLGRPGASFLGFLNVRYALFEIGHGPPRGWREIARGASAVLAENLHPLPRAFVPRSVALGSDPQRLGDQLNRLRRFARQATLEPWDGSAPAAPRWRANGPGFVETRRVGLGYRLEAHLERPGWIAVSVPAWRGWRAISAGAELPLGYLDHAFLGIHAPAGASSIDVVYRPRAFVVGRRISGAGLLLFAAALGVTLRRRRSAA